MIIQKQRDKIYTKCVEKWGFNSQVDRCIEEMAELTKALLKARRHEHPEDWFTSVREEIADVTITLEQMVILFEGEELVPQWIEEKLLRLKRLVEK